MAEIEFHFGKPRLTQHDRKAFEALQHLLEHRERLGVSRADWAAYRSLMLTPAQGRGTAVPATQRDTAERCWRTLAELRSLFGDLDGMHIAEIGAEHGWQCKLIADRHDFASYTIFDLAPMTELVFNYLARTGCPPLSRVTGAQLSSAPEKAEAATYDLVICNGTLSEHGRDEQDRYIVQVLRRSRRGYITYGGPSEALAAASYDRAGLIEALGFPVQQLDAGSKAKPRERALYWDSQPLLA